MVITPLLFLIGYSIKHISYFVIELLVEYRNIVKNALTLGIPFFGVLSLLTAV